MSEDTNKLVTTLRVTDAQLVELLDAHLSVRCVKKRWQCICGAELGPFVDFKPIDHRVHRVHVASAIADAIRSTQGAPS